MKLRTLIAASLLAIATPALADEYFAVTPSGAAEMLFAGRPATVIGQLSGKCIDAHWTVISSSPTELVCEAPMNFGQSVLGQMLMGNSYSTPPRRFFRFNVAEVSGVSRVQASGWMELQMAFGQTKRTDFAGPPFQNNVMNFMAAAGGKFPVGTTFPNHVVMGFESQDVVEGKYHAMRVTRVADASAAAKAGLQVGDVVEQVAGKRFKNQGDYLDAIAKAAQMATYDVGIERAGKAMTLKLDRAFRPATTETIAALVEPAPASPNATAAPVSVADELAKLVKLKEQGALTAPEFDAQKRKLLGM